MWSLGTAVGAAGAFPAAAFLVMTHVVGNVFIHLLFQMLSLTGVLDATESVCVLVLLSCLVYHREVELLEISDPSCNSTFGLFMS